MPRYLISKFLKVADLGGVGCFQRTWTGSSSHQVKFMRDQEDLMKTKEMIMLLRIVRQSLSDQQQQHIPRTRVLLQILHFAHIIPRVWGQLWSADHQWPPPPVSALAAPLAVWGPDCRLCKIIVYVFDKNITSITRAFWRQNIHHLQVNNWRNYQF